ncbi:MAG: endonuclease domain-containing protein [Cyanobacteria bacterium J06631_2]
MAQNFIRSDFHLPYNRNLATRARELRKNMTVAEKKLWYGYLRNFPLRVLRQKPIDNFIVDFYCAKLKLVIEVDGDSHFSPEAQAKDEERTNILQGYSLTVIRFTNDDVLHNFEAVCEQIHLRLQSPPC